VSLVLLVLNSSLRRNYLASLFWSSMVIIVARKLAGSLLYVPTDSETPNEVGRHKIKSYMTKA
jgi:hypothetical protein